MKTCCGNCLKVWDADSLNDIVHYSERVEAGEEEPVGECPECGALCHEIEDDETACLRLVIDVTFLTRGVPVHEINDQVAETIADMMEIGLLHEDCHAEVLDWKRTIGEVSDAPDGKDCGADLDEGKS